MAKIGIFGGSFNPPHRGHILALCEFREKLGLDRVLVIPSAAPPHKTLTANSASAQQRLQMTCLAVQKLPFAQVLDIELQRDGLSYTADTLAELRELFPNDELYLLMGTDMFLSFGKWYHPERITETATIAVAYRDKTGKPALSACAEELRERFHAQIVWVENSFLPYSSTSVRAMLAFHCAESYLTPEVLDYIRQNNLYYVGKDLKQLPFEELAAVSLSLHKKQRVAHVVGCSRTAKALAEQYGADARAAERAGILHDVTKALSAEEQLKLCERYATILDNFERENPKLLHAKTGAAVAKAVFGESDEVYSAIYWHTTGKADMSTLEKIVYLADYMEPNRDFDGVEELRRLTGENLDAAMRLGLQMTIAQLKERGRQIDKNSRAALRFLEERMQTQ